MTEFTSIVNLTPHQVNILGDGTIHQLSKPDASAALPRVKLEITQVGSVDGVVLATSEFGPVENEPPVKEINAMLSPMSTVGIWV